LHLLILGLSFNYTNTPSPLIDLLWLLGAYLLGSVPFGLLLARRFLELDLRDLGSGNIGATNALRAGGKGFGAAGQHPPAQPLAVSGSGVVGR
jgi:hypothetical protein